MDPMVSEWLNLIFRWVHVIAGVMWIGLLYFFNFINGSVAATFDADTKKKVVPELMPSHSLLVSLGCRLYVDQWDSSLRNRLLHGWGHGRSQHVHIERRGLPPAWGWVSWSSPGLSTTCSGSR